VADQYLIYGTLRFPSGKLAEWREHELVDSVDDWGSKLGGHEFEPITVGEVLDNAPLAAYGQLVAIEQTATQVSIEALVVDDNYWELMRPLAQAAHDAAGFGAEGELLFSEAPGHPTAVTLKRGKVALKSPRTPDDDPIQNAIIERAAKVPRGAPKKQPRKRR
jgi:hypothetical protein